MAGLPIFEQGQRGRYLRCERLHLLISHIELLLKVQEQATFFHTSNWDLKPGRERLLVLAQPRYSWPIHVNWNIRYKKYEVSSM